MANTVYNRKLNEKPRIAKFFTYWEFTVLMFVVVSPVALASMLELPPSFLDSIILLILFTLYIVLFKLGRPEGYFVHWVKHFFTPRHFRPGHVERPLPVDFVEFEQPTVTKKDLAATELKLLNLGFIAIGSGSYMPIDNILPERVLECREMLEQGEPISTLQYVFDTSIPQE